MSNCIYFVSRWPWRKVRNFMFSSTSLFNCRDCRLLAGVLAELSGIHNNTTNIKHLLKQSTFMSMYYVEYKYISAKAHIG